MNVSVSLSTCAARVFTWPAAHQASTLSLSLLRFWMRGTACVSGMDTDLHVVSTQERLVAPWATCMAVCKGDQKHRATKRSRDEEHSLRRRGGKGNYPCNFHYSQLESSGPLTEARMVTWEVPDISLVKPLLYVWKLRLKKETIEQGHQRC